MYNFHKKVGNERVKSHHETFEQAITPPWSLHMNLNRNKSAPASRDDRARSKSAISIKTLAPYRVILNIPAPNLYNLFDDQSNQKETDNKSDSSENNETKKRPSTAATPAQEEEEDEYSNDEKFEIPDKVVANNIGKKSLVDDESAKTSGHNARPKTAAANKITPNQIESIKNRPKSCYSYIKSRKTPEQKTPAPFLQVNGEAIRTPLPEQLYYNSQNAQTTESTKPNRQIQTQEANKNLINHDQKCCKVVEGYWKYDLLRRE